jgi:DNA-binding HxlR family transcriptional regulator
VRTYAQYCGLARALDVVGDRWTLLIVRELLLRESCRYTDLLSGLPGIATNLLAGRLADLEAAGVIVREEAPPPIATTIYRLTERGLELRPILHALGAWGGRSLGEPRRGDAFRSHWIGLPLEANLRRTPGPAFSIQLLTGDQPVILQGLADGVRVRAGTAPDAQLTLEGEPSDILQLLLGHRSIAESKRRGLQISGDQRVLKRLSRPGVVATAR